MVEIIGKSALTHGGFQELLRVRIGGEFTIRRDSYSGARPNALRIEGHSIMLVIYGGRAALRAKLYDEGIGYAGFQSLLSEEEKSILQKLASDIPALIWPSPAEFLKKKIESLGEEKVRQALQNLFKGVERTMRKIQILSAIPLIGTRLMECFYPCHN